MTTYTIFIDDDESEFPTVDGQLLAMTAWDQVRIAGTLSSGIYRASSVSWRVEATLHGSIIVGKEIRLHREEAP